MADMRRTNRNWLIVLALSGAAALSHPTAATAAACEVGVDKADTCAAQAGGTPRSRRQAGPRVFGYGRLGSGIVFADRTHHAPAIGIGLRAELDTFAVDLSVLNFSLAFDPYERSTDITVGSRYKLSALRFITPDADRSAYVGGGLSWGLVSVGRDLQPGTGIGATSWHGDGLQGELTVGYELARASGIRIFAQADATLPCFRAASETYAYSRPESGVQGSTGVEYRYVPSAVVSIGIGWQRHRR
jgi:hypothetical protein